MCVGIDLDWAWTCFWMCPGFVSDFDWNPIGLLLDVLGFVLDSYWLCLGFVLASCLLMAWICISVLDLYLSCVGFVFDSGMDLLWMCVGLVLDLCLIHS